MFFSRRNKIFFTRRITHTVNLKRERQLMIAWRIGLASLCGVVLVSVVGYSFWGHADVAVEYPSSCLGSWLNVSNAAGKPDLSSDASSLSFNGINSAVLLGGPGAGDKQIFCSGFSGDDRHSSSTVVAAQLSLSWTIAGKDQLNPDISAPTQNASTDTASSSVENQTASSSTETSTPPTTDTVPAETSTPPAPAALFVPKASPLSILWHAVSNSLFASGARAQEETPPPSPDVTPPPAPVVTPETTPPSSDATASPAPDTTSPPPSAASPSSEPAQDSSSSVPADQSPALSTSTASGAASDTAASSSDALPTASTSSSSGSASDNGLPSSASASSSETTPPAQSLPILFEIRYSFDGSVWDVAGRVTQADFKKSFALPLPSQVDLSRLQIAVIPIDVSSIGDNQAVYLDGMTLAVSYQDEKKIDGHRPRVSFSSDQTAFSPDEIDDTAFDAAGKGTPCVAQPFSQTIPVGGQAVYNIAVPNNGSEFVAKLGNYPQDMTPIFMPVSINSTIITATDTQATTTIGTSNTTTSVLTDSTTLASGTAQSIATGTDTTSAIALAKNIPGQTTLVINTTASTTPGSYTLVTLYGVKDADKNISTGLCQLNLIVTAHP
jgi:hypothetical protein